MEHAKTTVVTVCNQKGGQGKTSAVTALARGLARRGERVLAIDFDAQATLTGNFTPFADEEARLLPSLSDAYEADIYDWVARGEDARVAAAEGIDLVPATFDGVFSLEREMAQDFVAPAGHLAKALGAIAGEYAFVLIDTSSNINLPLTNALVASNAVLIPAEPRAEGLAGFRRTYEVVSQVAAGKAGLAGRTAVFAQGVKERPRGHRVMLGELATEAERLGVRMLASRIHENEPMADALGAHRDPFAQRGSIRAAREYDELIDELLAFWGVA